MYFFTTFAHSKRVGIFFLMYKFNIQNEKDISCVSFVDDEHDVISSDYSHYVNLLNIRMKYLA